MRFTTTITLGLSVVLSQCSCVDKTQEAGSVMVFAAASTTEAVTAVARLFTANTGILVNTHFAASSTLARQIEAGARGDVILCANQAWMDWLGHKALIDPRTRSDLLGNRLVLIVPRGRALEATLEPGFCLADQVSGPFARGDPTHVPAGMYAQQALQALGWYDGMKERILPGASVRVTLAYVSRAEADAGMVYVTDAAASDRVTVVAEIPKTLHEPIVYPVALCPKANSQSHTLLAFLQSERAMAVFESFGFEKGSL